MTDQQLDEGYFDQIFASWQESCLTVVAGDLDAKKEELRSEAQSRFQSFVSSADPTNGILESTLAKLLQALGPALTGSLRSRVCSLTVISASVQACQGVPVTIGTATLLSKFFLEQCAPIQDEGEEDFGEDYGEQIRDLAVQCLSALLNCPLKTNGDLKQMVEACTLLCSCSRQGVERRCALPMDDDDARYLSGVTEGLSTLPRTRRSNCFDLLQSATEGIRSIIAQEKSQLAKLATKVEPEMTAFVNFACQCLQGESDPRCLMQLLVLFHKVQVSLEPLFTAGKLDSFPTVSMFDAVAPYYPINFTPPPNDNHGITRAGLKGALLSVLSYFPYDTLTASKTKDTMMNLSLGLVTERLIPLDGDESNLATNPVEKKDALDDLEAILFPSENESILQSLPQGSAQQLSNALIANHQDAAIAATTGGSDANENKQLADSCRLLASKIASQLEGAKDKSHWNDFVKHPVDDMTSQFESAGSSGRIAIAYMASLVASGGPHTTRYVLDAALTKSVAMLKQYKIDQELATMAAYGVAAFFSSCHVAVDKATKAGVQLHPHPLERLSSSTFRMLNSIFADAETKDTYSLRHAVVVALESVLIVSPSDEYDTSDQDEIKQFVSQLAADVMEATKATEPIEAKSHLDLLTASAKALGGLLGKEIQCSSTDGEQDNSKDSSVLAAEGIQDILRNKVLVDLLYMCKQKPHSSTSTRFERIALARACSSGIACASLIIESMLHTLRDNLAAHSVESSLECAMALSYLLRNGSDVASRALHELSPSGVTAQEVIDRLCELDPRRERSKDSATDKTISALDLPATVEQLREVQGVRQTIVSLILPAYQEWVPKEEVLKSMSLVTRILPPLSSQDAIRLSVMLPLLSESLEHGNLPSTDEPGVADLQSTHGDLANYAINTDYDAKSRSAAASCLFSHIVHFAKKDSTCPSKKIMEDAVMPILVEAFGELGETEAKRNAALEKVFDGLNLSALLAYAAASRGGSSVATADRVAEFLVRLACGGKTSIPFVTDVSKEIDLSGAGSNTASTVLAIRAAGAFGSLLCGARPLWIQRVTHKTLKLLEPTLKEEKSNSLAANIGCIAVLSHIVCAGTLKSATLGIRGQVVKALVDCIESGSLTHQELARIHSVLSEAKRLVVASILKIAHTSPGLLSAYTEVLVIGLLRLYATSADADPLSDVACKLLILQVMERFCHMEIRKKALLAMKPAITSILGAAMNHPSRMLREAAVTVRNTWHTLPE